MNPFAGKQAAAIRPTTILGPRRFIERRRNSLLVRFFDRLLEWHDRSRERFHLRGLNDHQLRDIGLSRAEVEQESSKPFWKV